VGGTKFVSNRTIASSAHMKIPDGTRMRQPEFTATVQACNFDHDLYAIQALLPSVIAHLSFQFMLVV
jgi:hypothetical protein